MRLGDCPKLPWTIPLGGDQGWNCVAPCLPRGRPTPPEPPASMNALILIVTTSHAFETTGALKTPALAPVDVAVCSRGELCKQAVDEGSSLRLRGGFWGHQGSKPIFVLVRTSVVEEGTGKTLSPTEVHRGTVRLETLTFLANEPLTGLRRRTVTTKKFGPIWKKVGSEELAMGDYKASSTPHQFKMPRAVIPEISLARGVYTVRIVYTAESHPDVVLHEEETKFTII